MTRVILYKNGVGYFEHSGRIRGNQDVDIDFTTAQLNDVLKSLTVLDLGKGRITAVSYNSTASLERRLGSLHLPVGENPSTVQFLDALRGARLEVRSGSANACGRLLSIDQRELPVRTTRRSRSISSPRDQQRRNPSVRPESLDQCPHCRKGRQRTGWKVSWPGRIDTRSGRPPHGHLDRR